MRNTINEGMAGEQNEYDCALQFRKHCRYSTVPTRLMGEGKSRLKKTDAQT